MVTITVKELIETAKFLIDGDKNNPEYVRGIAELIGYVSLREGIEIEQRVEEVKEIIG